MWNKLYIIIDKKSVKPLLIWKFSGKDITIMVIGFCFGFFPFKTLFGDLYGFVAGISLFCMLAFIDRNAKPFVNFTTHTNVV